MCRFNPNKNNLLLIRIMKVKIGLRENFEKMTKIVKVCFCFATKVAQNSAKRA